MSNNDAKKKREKKYMFTMYMNPEASKQLDEIFAYRLLTGKKHFKSYILCEGINLMYKKTFRAFKRKNLDVG